MSTPLDQAGLERLALLLLNKHRPTCANHALRMLDGNMGVYFPDRAVPARAVAHYFRQ